MDFLLEALTNWLKEMLVGGIMSNLSGMFDSVNQQVADISVQVGQTPQGWNGSIFSMIENLSNSIMVPIAGVILAIVMTVDLIQMIADKNNLHDVDTWMIFKWVFKSAAAILIVTNTWNIVMGVFDMAQSVVAQAAGIIGSDASIDISSVMTDLEPRLMEMDLGPLFGLWFQSLFIGITMWALYICIFIVIYGRMIEIYLVTSVAPVPMAAMMGKEWGGMGQNYLRSLLALGFQAFLIIVCVAIYAVLVQNIALEDDIIMADRGAAWALYGHYHVGAVYLYLYRHLWPYDRDLPCDFGGSRPNGCHDGQGMGQYGTELPSFPAGTGLSGVSHHRLRGDLCCAGAEHRFGR